MSLKYYNIVLLSKIHVLRMLKHEEFEVTESDLYIHVRWHLLNIAIEYAFVIWLFLTNMY